MSVARSARFCCFFSMLALGCDPPEVGPVANPVPIVEATSPEMVSWSAGSEEVVVLGHGFVEGSVARWNQQDRNTVYQSPTRLRVTLTAADLQSRSGEIDVVNPAPGGGASDVILLVLGNPIPEIATLSPTQAPVGAAPDLTIRVSGTGFLPGPGGSRALWNGIPLSTVVASPSDLSARVPDYLLQTGDSAAVTVLNPAPGGGVSGPVVFRLENPVPHVTGTDPAGVPAALGGTIDVFGSGFTYGLTVWIGQTPIAPQQVSDSRLRIQVPGPVAVGGTTLSLRVANRAPGGGTSNAVDVAVWTTPPRIDYLAPSRVIVGSAAFTLTVTGADFDPGAIVTLNGDPRPVTFISATRLEVQIDAADVAAEGSFEIRVTNPGEGSVGRSELTVIPRSESTRVVAERWGSGEIVFSELDGSDATSVRIASGIARVDASPVYSTAAYHSSNRIYEIDAVTQVSRRLTVGTQAADLAGEAWPRYSGDGVWVYFIGNPNSGSAEIWRVRTDRSAAERTVSEPGTWLGFPSPAPGGGRLVYSVGGTSGGPLHVYDLGTGASSPLGVSGITSRWSPDEQWIVYLTRQWELRAVRPDGSGDFSVVSSVEVGFGFDFAADGQTIVATTQGGEGILISFPSGAVQSLPGLGSIASVAFFGP